MLYFKASMRVEYGAAPAFRHVNSKHTQTRGGIFWRKHQDDGGCGTAMSLQVRNAPQSYLLGKVHNLQSSLRSSRVSKSKFSAPRPDSAAPELNTNFKHDMHAPF